jgi:hypothetical protein
LTEGGVLPLSVPGKVAEGFLIDAIYAEFRLAAAGFVRQDYRSRKTLPGIHGL